MVEYPTTAWEERHSTSLRRGPGKTGNDVAIDVQNRDAKGGMEREIKTPSTEQGTKPQ